MDSLIAPADNSKSCDTLPAPNLAHTTHLDPEPSMSALFDPSFHDASDAGDQPASDDALPSSPSPTPEPVAARRLCVRHQRMADEGTNLQVQKSLDALPVQERETVNNLWSTFSSSTHGRRAIILQGLLTMCCSSELSLISEQLAQLIRIDPFFVFPREVSLKVLKYLDAVSLTRAAQVSRSWRSLADDDILWRNMCEQHIERKCTKCGWGLPLLERKRNKAGQPARPGLSSTISASVSALTIQDAKGKKRSAASDEQVPSEPSTPQIKKRKLVNPHLAALARIPTFSESMPTDEHLSGGSDTESDSPLLDIIPPFPTITRPWKDVYSERLKIERNWRRGRYHATTLQGHTDGVMCLQINESLAHPSFPVLITGSYDRTVRVWNLETGQEVRCLRGHTRAVRALQFDEAKLITGSMDRTLKVWNWRTGKCIRTLEGHTEGVVCLAFDANILASGSVDTTVKIWDFRTGECYTLRGHRDWVNAVTLWDGKSTAPSHHDPGVAKMLFSASDDGSIRLWDLATRTCVKQFIGHNGQVQSLNMVFTEANEDEEHIDALTPSAASLGWEHTAGMGVDGPISSLLRTPSASSSIASSGSGPRPLLISGSLDNTIKLWDIESGKTLQTYFGHIEGVWGVASDKLRLVSASHDRTIKIWVREEGKCMATLVGHRGAVTCLALADDMIVSGSDDGDVRIWSFAPEESPKVPYVV